MAHFIKGRIFVKEGVHVKAGQPIGIAGNSGFSGEPHLHINVLTNYDLSDDEFKTDSTFKSSNRTNHNYDDYRYSGTSTPFTFDDQFYIMNDIISR
jgi:murein DD-endopeptidase MepM/ murein hydrolase activator NlpD